MWITELNLNHVKNVYPGGDFNRRAPDRLTHALMTRPNKLEPEVPIDVSGN